jgi:hypothetical protein
MELTSLWRHACIVGCFFVLPACAGNSIASAGVDGSAGAGGTTGVHEKLRPPVTATDTSLEVLGADPVKCAGAPVPASSIVRACVLSASCSADPIATSVSDCIEKALPDSGALPACVVGAQSCTELAACTGSGYYVDACPAAAQFQVTCVGSKVVDCFQIPRTFSDCAKRGASCVRFSSNDDGTLDAAGCAVTPACSAPTDNYVCEGTKRVRCSHGVGLGEDCAARGLVCRDTPGGAVCAPSAPTCNQPGAGRCDAQGKGVYCDAEGRQFAFDCSRLGLACQVAPGQVHGIRCVIPACPPADAADCFEECDAQMAHLCIGGQRFSIDCHDYGFSRCVLETQAGVGGHVRCGLP